MTARDLLAGPWLAWRNARRALARPAHPAGAFRILLLHDVPAAQHPRLARLLDRIAKRGGFIGPDEALARLAAPPGAGARAGDPPWLVTFDDGFASNRVVAETMLAPRAIRAVFFVCPGLIDLPPGTQRDAVRQRVFAGNPAASVPPGDSPLMRWDDLAALAHGGHGIGGHSLHHARLSALGADELEREVAGTAARLADRLGAPADWFAYPFGDIAAIDAPALSVIGRHWRLCRSGVRGTNRAGTHRLALLADHVDLSATPDWQDLTVDGALDGRYGAPRGRLAAMAAASGHSAAP